jgi:hypothetical protein
MVFVRRVGVYIDAGAKQAMATKQKEQEQKEH